MKKTLFYLTITLLLASCIKDKRSASDEIAFKYPVPLTVALNTEEGYIINPVKGDSIQPLINSLGDTLITGVPVLIKGKRINPDNVEEPKIYAAGEPKVVPTKLNVHKIPETLTIITVNKDSLLTYTPVGDTLCFVLVNSYGDTIPTGVPIPTRGKVVPCIQPPQVMALPPSIKTNATIAMNYLDVEHGMKSPVIKSILEDSRGNLWFGTGTGGVSMYNGKTFIHFTKKEGLCGNDVTSILEDRNGNLWFGTTGGVSMYNGDTFIHFTEKEGLSNNNVCSIMVDRHSNLWFGTEGGGVSKYDGETFTHFTQNEGLISNWITSILEDRNGNLWFGTNGGAIRYNGDSLPSGQACFTTFTEREGLSHSYVKCILEDSHGNLWFGTRYAGVSKFDGQSFTHFTKNEGLSSNHVWDMVKDRNGNLWFGTSNGVNVYNGESFSAEQANFTHINTEQGLIDREVISILEDSYGNLWFGTYGGINMYKCNSFIHIGEKQGLGYKEVFFILEDSKGNLWFGTQDAGVSMYNGESFTHFTEKEGLVGKDIRSILEDSHGNLWFGTRGDGMSKFDGQFFTHFTEKEGLSSDIVGSILEDRYGNLWVGTGGGGVCKYDGRSFTHFTVNEGFNHNLVSCILEDRHGNLWFGTWGGGVSKYDGETFTHYSEKEGLSDNTISSIMEDRWGNIWFATRYGGISIFNGETLMYFTEKEGLSNNCVASILEDSSRVIWASTTLGLNRVAFCPEGGISGTKNSLYSCNPIIHTYGIQDGLKGITFLTPSAILDSRNRIWWGERKGLTMLDLNIFSITDKPPANLQLNRIEIKGQSIDYRNMNNCNEPTMEFSGVSRFNNYPLDLVLSYNRNHLTFHFSAIDWSAPHKILYSYKMEGLDKEWNDPSPEGKVDYRSLPFGKYIFKVKAIGVSQKWSETFEYPFVIQRPWWFRWWAFTFYAIVLILIARYYIRFIISRERIKAEIEIKQVEVDKMQELDKMKSRFFANISHEFRTPLTMLLGPVEDLIKRETGEIKVGRNILEAMQRNGRRLLRLINQLLDISKLETGKVNLQVSEGNLEEYVRTIIYSFLSLAESKQIKYESYMPDTNRIAYFDRDKLEKILTNLISNAFKFTPPEGEINVSLSYTTSTGPDTLQYIEIKVADTGKGIPGEEIDRIFDRFYQAGDSEMHGMEGTGIGLALTKELVELYHGEIHVESKTGQGSTFTVKLPVAKEQFKEEEIVAGKSDRKEDKEPMILDLGMEPPAEPEKAVQEDLNHAKDVPIILIVEDNPDLRNYISGNLQKNYRIIVAENGKVGLNSAIETIPDLVISDLMMPEMDGMEMCRKLKSDDRTNHIPVIMLTARADRGSKLEGLETGADDYLLKPFDAEELKIRIRNLIELRKKLIDKFRKEFVSETEDMGAPYEDQFMNKLMVILDLHVSDPDLRIDQLAEELHMSRSQVFRKVNALTGYTPNDLLRNLRLKKAASMFRSGHRHIAQVMHQVGFNNQSWFGKCFHELYGVTPSEYIKQKRI